MRIKLNRFMVDDQNQPEFYSEILGFRKKRLKDQDSTSSFRRRRV